ncbi:hypothetical protein DFH28DRAFT_1082169 [Melampsora americana]|nr:hypothetical protein DFH28DRAFT_1082169 [Melampsora americana]
MKLHGAPQILHKIQKLTDKVCKRLRGHDDFKGELMETKQSVVPRLIVPQLSAHTEDGTPQTGSNMQELMTLAPSLTLNRLCKTLSMKRDVPSETEEYERALFGFSLVSVIKRPYNEADALGWVVHPDPVILQGKHLNVHNYAPLLRLMKHLYLNVRGMIWAKVPGIDQVTSIEIKYASVQTELRSMFCYGKMELLLCEKDAVMYAAGHI